MRRASCERMVYWRGTGLDAEVGDSRIYDSDIVDVRTNTLASVSLGTKATPVWWSSEHSSSMISFCLSCHQKK